MYYFLFYNKAEQNYIRYEYDKLNQEIAKLKNMELKLFSNTENDEKLDKNKLAKNFLDLIKQFLVLFRKKYNNLGENTLKIYFYAVQNYFSMKGLLIAKKYSLEEECEYFKKMNKEKEESLINKISRDKKEMSKTIIQKKENKFFNYFDYETLTSKKMLTTLTTLSLISLSILSAYYFNKKYKK